MNVLYNSKDVADALNQYFVNVGSSIADKIPAFEGINNYADVNTAKEMLFTFNDVSEEFVFNQLCSFPDKKATGVDEIPSKLVNVSAKEITPIVIFLLNTSLKTCLFPSNMSKWKKGSVCTVLRVAIIQNK